MVGVNKEPRVDKGEIEPAKLTVRCVHVHRGIDVPAEREKTGVDFYDVMK